ncbi:YkgJ family cysteine cluster protein [Serratia rubidaea]|uniref:YkgJ family cysteine cluster protein n=1 Tax=Serratia rubidaea TaxID=61652 RepID=UPI00177CF0EA|nr:YkgJ family cysteine cluster protein [Serratia rubidaea]MBD8452895.1 YkgJ family cysteine cluster protein [Serratia rubidaea]
MSEILNPCVNCGACCAYFRVSFYWAEGDDGGGVVPSALTEPLTPFLRCMQGTNSKSPRCTALDGEIGRAVSCSIYLNRPTPCREFDASGENGLRNEACDRARERYGLPPLPVALPLTLPETIIAEEISAIALAGCHSEPEQGTIHH